MNENFHFILMLQTNELSNFEKPGSLMQFTYFMKEQKTGEWFVENAFKVSTFVILEDCLKQISSG